MPTVAEVLTVVAEVVLWQQQQRQWPASDVVRGAAVVATVKGHGQGYCGKDHSLCVAGTAMVMVTDATMGCMPNGEHGCGCGERSNPE